MKYFWFILFILIDSNIFAQMMLTTENQNLIHIASTDIKKQYVPAPTLKSAQEIKSDFKVEFVDFPQEAKTAFLYAVSIWENTISSPVPINIIARWEKLDNMVLAKTRPAVIFRSFEGAPVKNVYYPVTLVEKITGEETNISVPDVICIFNANMPWYFKTDGNTPESKYDLTTVVLHEIAHGLGFFGFLNDNNGMGFVNNASSIPSIYDYFIFNNINQQISDQSLFASPSEELHVQLTSGKLKFYNFTDKNSEVDKIIDWIYAPSVCKTGISLYHVNEDKNESRLMGPYTYRGEAIHKIDNITLEILSAMGWNSVNFDFQAPKDFEQPCDALPIDISVENLPPEGINQLCLIFSTDQFLTSDTIELYFVDSKRFEGKIPLNKFEGNLQYFFILNTTGNKSYFWPTTAPNRIFSLNIGTDYYPPEIKHNPVKMINSSASSLNLSADVEDNVDVKDVKVEYKINGVLQKEFCLSNDALNHYSGKLPLEMKLQESTKLEYRIVAVDKSALSNTVTNPVSGFYTVKVFKPYEPLLAYHTNFDNNLQDFVLNDFSISKQQGFSSKSLNSCHPYVESATENEYYNHIAQLKYPIVLKEGGAMSFYEVVLVEPGETGTKSTSPFFKDFVIVEGSKDHGKTWLPLTEGYDAQLQGNWLESYMESLNNGYTSNNINQDLYVKHNILVTENSNFNRGDTILVRFRLASNQFTTGWGWAIDNLDIQNETTDSPDILVQKSINVYPNPCKNEVNIDLSSISDNSSIEIKIFDLWGKTVYNGIFEKDFHYSRKSIDMSGLNSGIYLVTITDQKFNRLTKRIVKM